MGKSPGVLFVFESDSNKMTLAQKVDVNSFRSGGNSSSVSGSKGFCVVFMLCLQTLDIFLNSRLAVVEFIQTYSARALFFVP